KSLARHSSRPTKRIRIPPLQPLRRLSRGDALVARDGRRSTGPAALFLSSFEGRSQARINRLALQGQHAEDALVDAPERLAANETLQGLDAQDELPPGQRALQR